MIGNIHKSKVLLGGLIMLAMGLGVPGGLFSQTAPTVTAKVAPDEIRRGGTAVFTLTIENGQPNDTPQLKLPEGLEAISPTPVYSNQIRIFNGVRSQSTEFRWEISCPQNGRYVIPPQDVQLDGKPYHSNETRLVVKDNPSTPPSPYDPLLTMEIEKREIYLGESVSLTVNLYLHRQVVLRRVGLIETPKDNYAIQRFPQHPEESFVSMGGESYRAMAFRTTLSALKPGKFKLGPASTDLIVEVPMERTDMRGGNYFSMTEQRRMKAMSNDMELTVLPLPDDGKPANFSGIVGDFDMTASADLRDVTVGDPISVEINVTGNGNFDTLSPPGMLNPQPWKIYPARRTNIPRVDAIPEGGTHSATFNQVIIPRQMTDIIPPYEFSYFSPTKKKYFTARTQPIALHMQPGTAPQSAAAKPATAGSADTAPAEADKVAPPQPKITDIVTVLPTQVAWFMPRTSLLQDHQFMVWNLEALGVIGVLLLGKILVMMWRAHARSAATPQYALRRELRRGGLTRGSFYQLATRYVSLSYGDTGPFPEPVQEVLTRNEQINYSPEQEKAAAPVPRDERAKVLAALNA